MIYDTNLIIKHIRKSEPLPMEIIIPIPVVEELKSFAKKSGWENRKIALMGEIFTRFPLIKIIEELTDIYAELDAYSQGKLNQKPLPFGLLARNMGKNDLWIATSAIYFDIELHSTDNDFDHLVNFGLKFIKHNP